MYLQKKWWHENLFWECQKFLYAGITLMTDADLIRAGERFREAENISIYTFYHIKKSTIVQWNKLQELALKKSFSGCGASLHQQPTSKRLVFSYWEISLLYKRPIAKCWFFLNAHSVRPKTGCPGHAGRHSLVCRKASYVLVGKTAKQRPTSLMSFQCDSCYFPVLLLVTFTARLLLEGYTTDPAMKANIICSSL